MQQSGKMYCQDVHWINVFRLHPSVGLNGSITDHRQVLDNATDVEETTLCIYVNNIVVACTNVKDHFSVNINNI